MQSWRSTAVAFAPVEAVCLGELTLLTDKELWWVSCVVLHAHALHASLFIASSLLADLREHTPARGACSTCAGAGVAAEGDAGVPAQLPVGARRS